MIWYLLVAALAFSVSVSLVAGAIIRWADTADEV